MGEVVLFRKKKARKVTIKGEARRMLSTCLKTVDKPVGFVIVTVGAKGKMHLEFLSEPDLMPFDLLTRAETMAHAEKLDLLRTGEDEEEMAE